MTHTSVAAIATATKYDVSSLTKSDFFRRAHLAVAAFVALLGENAPKHVGKPLWKAMVKRGDESVTEWQYDGVFVANRREGCVTH